MRVTWGLGVVLQARQFGRGAFLSRLLCNTDLHIKLANQFFSESALSFERHAYESRPFHFTHYADGNAQMLAPSPSA
jgi:hypothetical protein